MKIDIKSKWGRSSRLKRRIHGFFSYILCSVLALFIPEKVDMALFKTLKDQFID